LTPPNPASATMMAWASKSVRRTGSRGQWRDAPRRAGKAASQRHSSGEGRAG
jgi:hypothetical protein